MPLTPLKARFVAEFAKDQNGTQAAIRAGASARSAGVTASRWLKDASVVAALTKANATALQSVQASQDEAIGTAEWIIRNAAETHREARENGQYGPAVTALGLIAKRLPEFKDGFTVDNRSVTFTLPEGTTLEDLKRLRQELQGG